MCKAEVETQISVSQFSCSVPSNSLWPHGLQHNRLPCSSPTPRAYSNSCPSSRWCYPTISSSVISFSCLQSFPVSGSFPTSQSFTSGGQSTGVSASASVLPMNIQDCFPLGWTGWLSLQSKGLFFFSFIFISWRLITLQYCSGFCHTLTWISHGLLRGFSNTTVPKHQFFGTQLSL